MRKLLWALAPVLIFAACNQDAEQKTGKRLEEISKDPNKISEIIRNPVSANAPADTSFVAKITFEQERYEFGEVLEGDIVRHTFKFKNTGKIPLIISEARSTCGCTVPTWPKEAIPPGSEGKIEVQFNTEHKTGDQEKPVTITANTYPNMTTVYVSGKVRPKK
ncbi:MAG TPA: DUF1573 domain-containing protein [Saprospiraceae bacterium]|nr:DUF1573 domain-containing protein [Saprospiraceae bacterium]